MLLRPLTAFFMLLFGLVALPAMAEIYKWVDANGKVHYSDQKPPDTAQSSTDMSALLKTAPEEPDEGELRRREYLKLAEQLPDRAAERAAAGRAQAVENKSELCRVARVHAEILKLKMRIYRSETGELRPHWFPDSYQGARTYIGDAERPGVIAANAAQLRANCADPSDTAAQLRAYNRWLVGDWCDSTKVDLDDALAERARSTGDRIERLRDEVAYWCGPGA